MNRRNEYIFYLKNVNCGEISCWDCLYVYLGTEIFQFQLSWFSLSKRKFFNLVLIRLEGPQSLHY